MVADGAETSASMYPKRQCSHQTYIILAYEVARHSEDVMSQHIHELFHLVAARWGKSGHGHVGTLEAQPWRVW